MNKSKVIELQKKAISQAKNNAKKWFNNGWGNQTIACYDVTFPDGSRSIDFKDVDQFNGFDFIYNGNVFCFVQYDGKMKVTKGENMTLKTLDDNLATEFEGQKG